MGQREVDASERADLRHGRPISLGEIRPGSGVAGGAGAGPDAPIALVAGDALVAIARAVDGALRPTKVFEA